MNTIKARLISGSTITVGENTMDAEAFLQVKSEVGIHHLELPRHIEAIPELVNACLQVVSFFENAKPKEKMTERECEVYCEAKLAIEKLNNPNAGVKQAFPNGRY